MKKKTLLVVFLFVCLLFTTTTCFATNDVKNEVHNATDTVIDGTQRLGNDIRSGIGNAEGAIENGAKNLGNSIPNGMEDIGNALTDGMDNMTEMSNYTAIRTTTTDMVNSNKATFSVWTWLTIAIAGAVIVGLVWYYAQEHEER